MCVPCRRENFERGAAHGRHKRTGQSSVRCLRDTKKRRITHKRGGSQRRRQVVPTAEREDTVRVRTRPEERFPCVWLRECFASQHRSRERDREKDVKDTGEWSPTLALGHRGSEHTAAHVLGE
ncbi:hypothetical protein TRVL_01840 [Trypanosoma vivax]|nr:hypothetical protein TRVL_01840 [Trypanosoma vivax]